MKTNAPAKTCWMLVDDNDRFLSGTAGILKFITKVDVECFNQPQAALAAFQNAPEKYELVISDLEMPGMDGVELCRRLRHIRPAIKTLLATGSGFFTADQAQHAGFQALLTKPFALTDLQATLKQTLASDEVKTPHLHVC